MFEFLKGDVSAYFYKIVSVFLLFTSCVIPLIINPQAIDWYYHPKAMALYFTCFFMLIVFISCYKNIKKDISNVDKVIMAYYFWIILSTIFSVNIDQSIIGKFIREEGLLSISCYLFLFFIASKYYVFSEKHIKFFMLSVFLITIYGISQYFGFDPIYRDKFMRMFNSADVTTIGNRNFWGTYLTLFLPIYIFYYLKTNKKSYLILSCILYTGLLCSMTRGSWVGFFISFMLIIIYIYKYKLNKKRFIIILSLFILITLFMNTLGKQNISNRFNSIFDDSKKVIFNLDDKSAGSYRMFIWTRSIKLIPQNALLGCGPDCFDVVFMKKYKNEVNLCFGNVIVDKAHNEYLNLAVTCGIPALALYLSFVFLIFKKAYKSAKSNIIVVPFLCSIIGYLVQAFFNISVVSVAPIFWIILGILYNVSENDNVKIA